MTRDRFVRDTVAWINGALLPPGVIINEYTPLFDDGLIDSIRILKLIAWTERSIGREIPDHQIRMDLFQDVATMATTFVEA